MQSDRYKALYAHAFELAADTLAVCEGVGPGPGAAMVASARRMMPWEPQFDSCQDDTAVCRALTLWQSQIGALVSGVTAGTDLMRREPGLWQGLMTDWPMGSYADALCRTATRMRRRHGRALELGSGVGNSTLRLLEQFGDQLTWSDKDPALVHRGRRRFGGRGIVLDFDRIHLLDAESHYDNIFATNALHCAADLPSTLVALREILAPRGQLVIAEGFPVLADGSPWALDIFFQAFEGWWDRTGFLTDAQWAALIVDAGFTRLDIHPIVEGALNVGAVYVCSVEPIREFSDACASAEGDAVR